MTQPIEFTQNGRNDSFISYHTYHTEYDLTEALTGQDEYSFKAIDEDLLTAFNSDVKDFNTGFTYFFSTGTTSELKNNKGSLEEDSYVSIFLNLLKNNTYEEGICGITEYQFLEFYTKKYELFNTVCNRVWQECYKSENQSIHAHYLNAIVNISEELDQSDIDLFLPFAVSALSHKDIRIKEAGVAMFERWDNSEHKGLLSKVDSTGVVWLDEYKNSVLEALGE
ncbi:hypothetical protein [Pseudoalteromonas sp. Z1A2]|uniref:hypothetical protein n=1 Tax=Pseudoalteromonas sp. Z1A2 TaxID=2686350 RepID=UPI0013FDFDCB|nr:hypothetical protein [Pseudoalteromonas sp. Z1A2]